MYPYLPLSEIDLDAALVKRLPRHLAYFHLALPVAEDDEEITVALAQPDNRAVWQVIETALGRPIVPVHSSDSDIRAVLDRVWQDTGTAEGGVWAWTEDPAHRDALAAFISRVVTPAYPQLDIYISDASSLDTLVETARDANVALIVAHTEQAETRRSLLLAAPSAIWLTRTLDTPPTKLVAVLRLNTPDRQLLDWVPPLNRAIASETVVLAAAEPAATPSGSPLFSRLTTLLTPSDPRGTQVADLRRDLTSLGVHGRLRVREGTLGAVILDEATHAPYDLLIMAAEASGGFAAEVFEHIWHRLGGALLIKAG